MDREAKAKKIFEISRNPIPGISDTWELIADYVEVEIKKAERRGYEECCRNHNILYGEDAKTFVDKFEENNRKANDK